MARSEHYRLNSGLTTRIGTSAIPLSLSRAELAEADEQFLDADFNPSFYFTAKHPFANILVPGSGESLLEAFGTISTMLSYQYTVAVCCLAASLISIILTYTFGAVSDIEHDADRFQIWWWFCRWIVLSQISLTVIGVFYTYYAFNVLVFIKFAGHDTQPDCYTVDESGKLKSLPGRANWGFRLRCPQEYNGFAQFTFLLSSAGITLFILCIANIPIAAITKRRAARTQRM